MELHSDKVARGAEGDVIKLVGQLHSWGAGLRSQECNCPDQTGPIGNFCSLAENTISLSA